MATGAFAGEAQILDERRQMQTVEADRAMFAACLAIFRASGWWSKEQIAGYTQDVGQIMNCSDEDARQAARDFWASRTDTRNSAAGINQRIRSYLAQAEREAA